MTPKREYPDQPLVGVGGVVIDNGRALLIRRGSPPLEGQWSIPGGLLELGETLAQGVARELAEETGLEVNVLELIEAFERIYPALPRADGTPGDAVAAAISLRDPRLSLRGAGRNAPCGKRRTGIRMGPRGPIGEI